VTARSTSTGDRPGASVSTETWIVETSGTASIGSVRAANAPAPSYVSSSTSISPLKRIDFAIRLLSMANERSPT
jgi:hypothetical protein